jgi:hypothetical protein
MPVAVDDDEAQRVRPAPSLETRRSSLREALEGGRALVVFAEYRRVPHQVRSPALNHSERARPRFNTGEPIAKCHYDLCRGDAYVGTLTMSGSAC